MPNFSDFDRKSFPLALSDPPQPPSQKDLLKTQRPKIRHRTRVQNALKDWDCEDLAFKIRHCGKRKNAWTICSSLWCHECAKWPGNSLGERMYDHVGKIDPAFVRERLIFATPLFGLAPLDDFEAVEVEIEKARKGFWKALKRRFKRLWWQGAFELELIDTELLSMENEEAQIKTNTINAMRAKNTLLKGERFLVLVHAHVLIDIGPHNEEEIKEWMADKLGDERRSYCKRTFQGQTLKQVCHFLGHYPFKCRVQYNPSFRSQDHVGGGYFSDYCLAKLVMLHDRIMNGKGQRGFLIYRKVEDEDQPTGLEPFFKDDAEAMNTVSEATHSDEIDISFFDDLVREDSVMDTNVPCSYLPPDQNLRERLENRWKRPRNGDFSGWK